MVIVQPSMVDPEVTSSLSSEWICIHGILEEAKKVPFIKMIFEAIGKLVEVDVLCLVKPSPVRL